MTTVEQKRNELANVNANLNKLGRLTKRQISKMNTVSKKMMLANLNTLMAQKQHVLNEIIAYR